ncbi:NAD(P)-binding domain protein [Akanthomyces lecanii RCEF 1005]|uniref:NAD(P)-binding domain protein n=1 Tax=Akanthomyces lecanii RCEF 1005 TaxID=1081108 RepID=A0A167ZNH6_CORDF|nr:NAD(P)-binding domain protein [Akanthomyces lecanii RCEF 1005]
MHLFILGGTGQSGGFAYKYALEQGYHVTLLVRKVIEHKHANLTMVEGSVLSQEDMDRAFAAAGIPVDSALQFLNVPRESAKPWSKFIGPPRLLADATANAARALRGQQRRAPLPSGRKPVLVAMNALGAGDSIAVTPFITKIFINHSSLGKTYEEHSAVLAELEDDCGKDVDWTAALAVGLSSAGAKPVKTFSMTERGASMMITRESCATWMVNVAAGRIGERFSRQAVIVSN